MLNNIAAERANAIAAACSNLPHTKPISGYSLCSITFSEHDTPIIDASLQPNIGLQHLHTCPYRTPERRSKEQHLSCVLATNTPTLCHKPRASSKLLQRIPLLSDFVNNDPSTPLPRGLARLGNSNEILIITTGTFRHQLPRNLINAYASFFRHNAHTHPIDFARALGTLLASALEPPPNFTTIFRSLPPILERFLAHTIQLSETCHSPFTLERHTAYTKPLLPGIVHHTPPTPSPWNLHIHNGVNPENKPSFTVVHGAQNVQFFTFLAHLLGAA